MEEWRLEVTKEHGRDTVDWWGVSSNRTIWDVEGLYPTTRSSLVDRIAEGAPPLSPPPTTPRSVSQIHIAHHIHQHEQIAPYETPTFGTFLSEVDGQLRSQFVQNGRLDDEEMGVR
mmetsp:Transcript_17204/g.21133  ORF Transcript_17204/g.21133 Transcript_17204/m.21133 type:complete len:116 (+) Transcript_17204:691-1038(+)